MGWCFYLGFLSFFLLHRQTLTVKEEHAACTVRRLVSLGYSELNRCCRRWQELDVCSPLSHTHTQKTVARTNNSSPEVMQISPIILCTLALAASPPVSPAPHCPSVFPSHSWMFDGAASCSLVWGRHVLSLTNTGSVLFVASVAPGKQRPHACVK